MVVTPAHYNQGKIQPYDFYESQGIAENFYKGSIIKYIVRERHKNGLEDLLKAQEYLKRLIKVRMEELEAKEKAS